MTWKDIMESSHKIGTIKLYLLKEQLINRGNIDDYGISEQDARDDCYNDLEEEEIYMVNYYLGRIDIAKKILEEIDKNGI